MRVREREAHVLKVGGQANIVEQRDEQQTQGGTHASTFLSRMAQVEHTVQSDHQSCTLRVKELSGVNIDY